MNSEVEIKGDENILKGLIEGPIGTKKSRVFSQLIYISKPLIYPVIVMLIILSIALFLLRFNSDKIINSGQKLYSDSLSLSYSENSRLFNNSIVHFTKEINQTVSNPFNFESFSRLMKNGDVLLDIDSLSDAQINLIKVNMQQLNLWKSMAKFGDTLTLQSDDKNLANLKNEIACIYSLISAEANGIMLSLPCGKTSGRAGKGVRFKELSIKLDSLLEEVNKISK